MLTIRCQRDEPTARPQDAAHLAQEHGRGGDVFQHPGAGDEVEAGRREGDGAVGAELPEPVEVVNVRVDGDIDAPDLTRRAAVNAQLPVVSATEVEHATDLRHAAADFLMIPGE